MKLVYLYNKLITLVWQSLIIYAHNTFWASNANSWYDCRSLNLNIQEAGNVRIGVKLKKVQFSFLLASVHNNVVGIPHVGKVK